MASNASMTTPAYDKTGKLHKLGYINQSWKERIFAISVEKQIVNYFKTEEDFQAHVNNGAQNQAGTIVLKNSVMYLADYMDKRFCIELAIRDTKNVTTRHFFIYAESGNILRDWLVLFHAGGTVAAGPTFPMRVVPDAFIAQHQDATAGLPRSYSTFTDDAALLPPLDFPVVLAKFGFLQKKGVWNTSYKTRFCRVQRDSEGQPILVYYDSVETTKSNGFIPLTSLSIDEDKSNPDELCFKLTSSGSSRTWFLRAPSRAQKRKWIALLTRVSEGETMATEDTKLQVDGPTTSANTLNHNLSPKQFVDRLAAGGDKSVTASSSSSPPPPSVEPEPEPEPVSQPQVRIVDGKPYRVRKVKRGSVMIIEDDEDEINVIQLKADSTVPAASAAVVPAAASSSSSSSSASSSGATDSSSWPPPPPPGPPPPDAAAPPTVVTSPQVSVLSPASFNESPPTSAPTPVPKVQQTEPKPVMKILDDEDDANDDNGLKYPNEDDMNAAEVASAFARCQQGCDMFKVPRSSFAKIERKRFYLLEVAKSPKAQRLVAEATKEMKQKDAKKVPYYESIKSGYLLHWDSTKAFVYESFVWLDPAASTSTWNLFFGQKHGLFTKKKLKDNFAVLEGQSFTIETPKRSFDLIVEHRQDFIKWRLALEELHKKR